MTQITKHFFRGILVLIPIVVTVYVVWFVMDNLAPLFNWMGSLVVDEDATAFVHLALGIVVTVTLITFVGLVAANFIGARLVALVDRLFDRVPLIRLLHGSIKDLLSAFVGDKKSFDRPVLVNLTADGSTRVVGFITCDDLSFLGTADDVAVYLPQSYNFAGNLIVVGRDRVTAIDTPSSDVMAFLVSGGVSAHEKGKTEAPPAGTTREGDEPSPK